MATMHILPDAQIGQTYTNVINIDYVLSLVCLVVHKNYLGHPSSHSPFLLLKTVSAVSTQHYSVHNTCFIELKLLIIPGYSISNMLHIKFMSAIFSERLKALFVPEATP